MRPGRFIAALLLSVGSVLVVAGPVSAQESTSTTVTHESEECIHILEEGGKVADCHKAPSPILPATNELIWGTISFVVLFFLLAKFAYPAIQKSMQARTEKIRENLDEADRVKAEAQTVLDDYQRQLADARNESNRIIEEARQTADQLRRDLMQRAETEVQELKTRTQADIAAARDRAMADLQTQVASLAVELAEKVVERNLDRDTNMRLVESYIQQLGSSR
jgi:F-type H+-transporting ATPase subunit b